MTRLSAHIGYLYTDLPLADRIAAAARDGFTAVEHPEPWAIPAAEMAARLSDLGLRFSQVTSGMGGAGEKGLAALPGREGEFRAGFRRALDYALAIGCPFVHPMAGVHGDDTTYRGNIDWSLRACDGTGAAVLVEAIALPGYQLAGLGPAIALQDGHPGIRLLFDSYHAVVQGEDPAAWLQSHAPRVGHVHIADYPGRHEPGTGRIDFAALLAALQAAGYAGAIGFEYIPRTETTASTRFLSGWKQTLGRKDPE
jgi:hydroxypyruvate isomerase